MLRAMVLLRIRLRLRSLRRLLVLVLLRVRWQWLSLLLLLLLANTAYFVWAGGYARSWGLAPPQQTEPQRLAQQIHPGQLRLLPPLTTGPVCLETEVLRNPDQVEALRQVAATELPDGSWQMLSEPLPLRWIVYLGPYLNAELVERKKAELQQLQLPFEAPANPALEPGLALGSFATEAQAQQTLAPLAQKGIRTARVLPDQDPGLHWRLRLPKASAAPELDALRPALAGQRLQPCR